LETPETRKGSTVSPDQDEFSLSDEALERIDQQLRDKPISENKALQDLLSRPEPWS